MRLGRWVVAVAVTLLVGGVETVEAQTTPGGPQQVIALYEWARRTGDVDAALAQFADDAVVTVQGRARDSYTGKEQVRAYLMTIGLHFQTVTRTTPLVQGNVVTWTERDEAGPVAFDANVVASVGMGRITSLVYGMNDPYSIAGPGAPAAGAAIEPEPAGVPSLAWTTALALIGLVLLAVVFGRPRRRASQSQLDGRLLLELRRQRRAERRDKAA